MRQCKHPACLNKPLDDFDLCLKHLRKDPDYLRAWWAAGKATNHPLVHEPGFIEAVEFAVYLATKETLANKAAKR